MKKFVAMTAAVVAFGMIMTGCGEKEATEPAKETPAPAAEAPKTDTTKPADSTAPAGNEQVIHVTATNWKWEMDKTEVKKGQPVKMIIEGKEGMHGITVEGTSINNEHVMQGKPVEVTFTPDKAGDLNIICSIMCGTGHGAMKSTLKVVD